MTGDINRLTQSITEATIPAWLWHYLREHKNEMIFDLKIFGKHEITCPDGQIMTISRRA